MFEYLYHISVLGSENVGKKTLAKSRFLTSPSILDDMLTMGVEFSATIVEIYETKVKLLFRIFSRKQYFWDKTQRVNLEIHVRSSNGAVILYDITNPKTLEQVPRWIQIVKDNAGDIPILLVGNKLDLEEQREISKEQVEKVKEHHHISSAMEISVKTGENVEKMFLNLAGMTLKNLKETLEK